MDAGKPKKQALAIAYAQKKRFKKAAKEESVENYDSGGAVIKSNEHSPYDWVGEENKQAGKSPAEEKPESKESLAVESPMDKLKRQQGANDGSAKATQWHAGRNGEMFAKGGMVKENEEAMEEDDRMLGQHGEDEMGPDGVRMADGGQIEDNYQTADRALDMVGRIMDTHQKMYSKGGQVANDTPITADFESNNFDDLVHRDDLESSYTGKNSGDELGNAGEDARRSDIISRIMKSRAKKDRMPNPA